MKNIKEQWFEWSLAAITVIATIIIIFAPEPL